MLKIAPTTCAIFSYCGYFSIGSTSDSEVEQITTGYAGEVKKL